MAYAVITRDAEAAAPYAAALAALGLATIATPVTRFAPPPDPDALARALATGGHAAIVVASARAATALAAARSELARVASAAPRGTGAAHAGATAALPEVWAVGPATARALADAGIAAELPPQVKDGAGLAHALLAHRALAGRRVLVPRAEDGRDEAIAILTAAGAEVDAITAYRTLPIAPDDPDAAHGLALLQRGEADVCALFAPSQVTALAALLEITALRTQFAAIGETTAAALRQAGVASVAVAGAPTPEGLAKAVSAVYPHRP